MEDPAFVIQDRANPADVQFLEDRINQYNVEKTGYNDGREIAIFLRDEQDRIAAGLWGWTWGGCMEIKYLWVREDWRGKDYGTLLLVGAEKEGATRGCSQVTLSTHSFQAPVFYQKLGYTVFGVIDGYPEGYKQYFLKKSLK